MEPKSTPEEIETKVARIAARKDDWVKVPIPERIRYLERARDGVLAVAERWVEEGCRIKGLAPGDALAGEEWLVGPTPTVRNIRLLIEALESGGKPAPRDLAKKGDQYVATVFPLSLRDHLMFAGFRAEIWIEPGKPASQGRIYRERDHSGKTCLVLGGGNVSSIPPMDLLYKLFVEDEVVVLKMNPVNATIGPFFEQAFRALIEDGFLAIVYGGGDVGAHLATHSKIDTLHVTGSDRTYDAIVWGADGAERARRKASGERANTRPFSAELGCVTPILVVPGPWSAADIDFQARHVASMVANNASFNCNAAKVLVVAKGWLQRDAFLAKVAEKLAQTRARKAYYPGAEKRYAEFLDKYPRAKGVGPTLEGSVPWTVIPDVTPDDGEHALTHEAFCGVLAEVTLDANDAPSFLERAVPFANDRCWGTLSCSLFAHGFTMRDHGAEIEKAIADLRYGAVGVNCWSALAYALVVTSWGAWPGSAPEDIRSGVGVVHDALLFDHPQKSVVRAPFRIRPTPAWFVDHKNLEALARRLLRYEAAPSWGAFASVAAAGMLG
jgi:acyl-CoA reductase-like NAD-dependent aldehyde dehydrogenase